MSHWLAYAPARREFEARDAIAALGIHAIVPRRVDLIRHGKRRFPDAVVSPILPNYLFLDITDAQWHQVAHLPTIRLTLMGIGPKDWRDVQIFATATEADFASRMAEIDAGSRVSEYQPGDALKIISGALSNQMATFRRIIESRHSPFPVIEAEINIMGRVTPIRLDPVNTCKA